MFSKTQNRTVFKMQENNKISQNCYW